MERKLIQIYTNLKHIKVIHILSFLLSLIITVTLLPFIDEHLRARTVGSRIEYLQSIRANVLAEVEKIKFEEQQE